MSSERTCRARLGSKSKGKRQLTPFPIFGAFDEAAKLLNIFVEGEEAEKLVFDARDFQRDSLIFPKA